MLDTDTNKENFVKQDIVYTIMVRKKYMEHISIGKAIVKKKV